MIYTVLITDRADRDIRAIYEYIAYHLGSPENAENTLDKLENSIMKLERLPYRYRAYEREPWKSRGFRVMPVENYLVFYVPDDEKETVSIVRVMYGGRDIEKHIDE